MSAPTQESDAMVTTADPGVGTDAPRGLPFWANPRFGLLVVIVVLVIVFTSLRSSFLNTSLTLVPMQQDVSVFLVVGLAQLCVLSLGHMNLAVPRMAAISAFAMGWCYQHLSVPLWLGLLIGLVVGAAVGALAGWIITATGVNSFIVTLALDFALVGLVSLLYSHVGDGVAFPVHPAGMTALRNDTFSDYCAGNICGPPVPLIVPIALVAALLVAVLFRLARVGREMLMTGSNLRAARLSGIPTSRRIIQAHALSGALAALAGFLLAVNSGAFSADIGNSFLLPSFLGPVLGGTLLSGGAVSILGTVLGAALTEVIRTGLNLLNFSVQDLNIYIGLVLLVALSLDRVRHVLAERRGTRA
ncbi:MAG: ribose transport system permease protein [Pseudonocardiales bacterium]|jgi:ribose transport system permease protein|nr:Sugar transporter permease component [Pseudonocardiales bacterium]MDT4960342.1 ribose transport system permease protein [Pseudonocardiales bacterium]MDT4964743.1 ribose transport system permease protein [Pseudonocardiales bacterium]MDT4970630.1 ribose transport system permease protein [Pseudonocardiales bacterium]MDT4981832.1 ribose transport system permease protein [Pseudonocardiales bacterium]